MEAKPVKKNPLEERDNLAAPMTPGEYMVITDYAVCHSCERACCQSPWMGR